MTWSLDFNRDPARIARLTERNSDEVWPRWDGTGPPGWGATELRQLLAGARFEGGPGREREAAEAWTFELEVYFKRGIRDREPEVTYADGTYTVVGWIETTHPGDHPKADGIVWFT